MICANAALKTTGAARGLWRSVRRVVLHGLEHEVHEHVAESLPVVRARLLAVVADRVEDAAALGVGGELLRLRSATATRRRLVGRVPGPDAERAGDRRGPVLLLRELLALEERDDVLGVHDLDRGGEEVDLPLVVDRLGGALLPLDRLAVLGLGLGRGTRLLPDAAHEGVTRRALDRRELDGLLGLDHGRDSLPVERRDLVGPEDARDVDEAPVLREEIAARLLDPLLDRLERRVREALPSRARHPRRLLLVAVVAVDEEAPAVL